MNNKTTDLLLLYVHIVFLRILLIKIINNNIIQEKSKK